MKKGIIALMFFLTTAVLLLTPALSASAEGEQKFWLNGVFVYAFDDHEDILGDGTASYDAATKTLTLNNAILTKGKDPKYDSPPYCSPLLVDCDFELTVHLVGDNYIYHPASGEGIMSEGNLIFTAEEGATLTCDAPVNCNSYTQNSGYIKIRIEKMSNTDYYWCLGCSKSITMNGGTLEAVRIGKGCAFALWASNQKPQVPKGTVMYEGENGFEKSVTKFTSIDPVVPWLETYHWAKIICPDYVDDTVITPTYKLSVTNGSGSGTYTGGQKVKITADAASEGKIFKNWTAEEGSFDNNSSASTTFTMPESDVKISAIYQDLPKYELTITNGSGSGTYYAKQQITITADAPEKNKQFDKWIVIGGTVDNEAAIETTVIMPSASVTATASYKDAPKYKLTVNYGTGSGEYFPDDTITVTAENAPEGKMFDRWEINAGTLADAFIIMTELTMPEGEVILTATYKDIPEDIKKDESDNSSDQNSNILDNQENNENNSTSNENNKKEEDDINNNESKEEDTVNNNESKEEDTVNNSESKGEGDINNNESKEEDTVNNSELKEEAAVTYILTFVSGKSSLIYEISCSSDEIESITVDGMAIANVTSEFDNKTRITLPSGYVSTLPDGSHELLVNFSNGTGSASFLTPCEFVSEQAGGKIWIIVGSIVILAGMMGFAFYQIKKRHIQK